MLRLHFIVVIGLFIWAAGGHLAKAASVRPTVSTGLMVPPASQYYHLVYGGQIDIAREVDDRLLRLQYLQRPAFSSRGYTDQDFSGLFMLGQSVLKSNEFGVTALFGGGYAWGYIKSTEDQSKSNSYKLPGMAVGIEGRWSSKTIDVRLSHQVLVAHNTREQLNAYVVWPFNWFIFSLSRPFSI